MHLLPCSDYGVNRAWRQALHAADTAGFVDDCQQGGPLDPVGGIQRQGLAFEQRREGGDGRRAARRALVDRRKTVRDGLSVGSTTVKATACALRLWQQGVD